jgi:hypothetical protein
VTYIGGTKEPDKIVDQFQNDERVQFFLGNLDCASTSITLTAARHVVLAEQFRAPSDEDQSIAPASGARVSSSRCQWRSSAWKTRWINECSLLRTGRESSLLGRWMARTR